MQRRLEVGGDRLAQSYGVAVGLSPFVLEGDRRGIGVVAHRELADGLYPLERLRGGDSGEQRRRHQ
jgi:hypothetical protein